MKKPDGKDRALEELRGMKIGEKCISCEKLVSDMAFLAEDKCPKPIILTRITAREVVKLRGIHAIPLGDIISNPKRRELASMLVTIGVPVEGDNPEHEKNEGDPVTNVVCSRKDDSDKHVDGITEIECHECKEICYISPKSKELMEERKGHAVCIPCMGKQHKGANIVLSKRQVEELQEGMRKYDPMSNN